MQGEIDNTANMGTSINIENGLLMQMIHSFIYSNQIGWFEQRRECNRTQQLYSEDMFYYFNNTCHILGLLVGFVHATKTYISHSSIIKQKDKEVECVSP